MKKRILAYFTLVALLVVAFGSCKKDASRLSQVNSDNVQNTEICNEKDGGERYDLYTYYYLRALDIVDSLSCNKYFDTEDMYSLGNFLGSHVFCIPSIAHVNFNLIIFPDDQIRTAFMIRNIQDFTSANNHQQYAPLKSYDYEIFDACATTKLFDGKIYPNSGDMLFTVTNTYTSNFAGYEYNLPAIFGSVNVGTYTYTGMVQGTSRITLDEFLFNVAKECYYHF